jgi:hypothetical protein
MASQDLFMGYASDPAAGIKTSGSMRNVTLLLSGLGLAVLIFSCGSLESRTNQFTARRVMVGTLLATPEVSFNPLSLFSPDGGFPADGGFGADAGTVTLGPQTVAFMYFGQRTRQSLDTPPDPISTAVSYLDISGGSSIDMPSKGSGTYLQSSAEKPALEYRSAGTYEFRASFEGQAYVGEVQDTPLLERIAAFHPPSGYVAHSTGEAFTFNRPPPPEGIERPMGFVTVIPLGEDGSPGAPTYTNVPTTPLEFLQLIALPASWKATLITVPGSAFAQPKSTYVVVFQAAKVGGAKSENLFIGSAILAGTADFAIVRTR